MAKKKVEVTLQDEVETQEDWETILQREGLTIIDVYQDWSGPCKAVVGLFRRLKTELNDDLLHFAVAKSDTVEALEKYRGKCEPCFLFFGGGCLVAAVRGVNPPELEKNIVEKLKQEHEVMKGEIERVEIRDPVLVAQELEEAEERRRKEEEEEVLQEVTIAVLKPDIVSSGKAEDIIRELGERGIEILERKEHVFTTEEAEKFYEKLKDEPYYNNLVDFMTSGPSEILICAKGAEGIIEELRGLIGPALYQSESDEEKQCIRAKYAQDTIRNAIHAADSKEEAARELAFFYPEFQPPTVRVRRVRAVTEKHESSSAHDSTVRPSQYLGFGPTPPGIQRTVALLRPMAYALYKDEILERIKEAGFVVAIQKEIQLSKQQAEDYYREHEGQMYFGELTTMMSSGPMLALLLARQDAVATWREMLGPTDVEKAMAEAPESLRAQFVSNEVNIEEEVNGEVRRKPMNLLHGSCDSSEAERDMNFFFPMERTVAAIKPDAYANRDEIIDRIKLAGFHVAARKDTQLSVELARQLYADIKDRPFYEDLVNHMTSGRTLFMVLTRQDAVAGWRNLMGPTDPDAATEATQDTADPRNLNIRATYGRNVLENAVHGSSNEEHANRTIELIFGDPEIGLPGHAAVDEEQEAETAKELPEDVSDVPPEDAGITNEPGQNPDSEAEPADPATADAAEAGLAEEAPAEAPAESAIDAPAETSVEEAVISVEAPAEPVSVEPSEPAGPVEPKDEEAPAEAEAEAEATPGTQDAPPTVEPVEPDESQAGSTAAAVAENQNQSASSRGPRVKSGVSSTSSVTNSIGEDIQSQVGDHTPRRKSKRPKSSARSHDTIDSDQGTVLSFVTVDSVSCQCNPYFRPGKRRKEAADNVARKRANFSVDPARNKQNSLKNFIRKRNISTH